MGIETLGQKFSPLLEKGTELPCSNTKQYTTSQDNQPELRITVFQFPAETDRIDMEMPGAACLGEFHLGPLPEAPKGQIQIDVTFDIDENGLMTVAAKSTGNEGLGKELEVNVS